MYRGPEVQPYAEAPRVTPADTIPVHGGEPPMSLEQATIKMHNPLESTPENLAKGKEQFTTYCAPCHGESGQGNGPVAHILAKPPKNLVVRHQQGSPRRLHLRHDPRRQPVDAFLRGRNAGRTALAGDHVHPIDAERRRETQSRRQLTSSTDAAALPAQLHNAIRWVLSVVDLNLFN